MFIYFVSQTLSNFQNIVWTAMTRPHGVNHLTNVKPFRHVLRAWQTNRQHRHAYCTTPCLATSGKSSVHELSYCKQIARQLRTQYVEGFCRPKCYPVTLKCRLKVTWKWYHLKAFHSNYSRIFSHFGDIQRQRMASPWNLGLGSFKVIENGAVR